MPKRKLLLEAIDTRVADLGLPDTTLRVVFQHFSADDLADVRRWAAGQAPESARPTPPQQTAAFIYWAVRAIERERRSASKGTQ